MGPVASKFFNSDNKAPDNEGEKTSKLEQVQDVRSPSSQIFRTPIVIVKNCDGKYKADKLVPPRTKLMKNIKLDPRSPTSGIYRTPILIEDSFGESTNVDDSESPVSIYSCNLTEFAIQDVPTPADPSPNVSDFKDHSEVNDYLDNNFTVDDTSEEEIRKKKLRVTDRPKTYEARKLLDEIMMSEEENFLSKVSIKRKGKKAVKKISENKFDLKGKSRTPLSNITLCTNSPNQPNTGGKLYSRSRVLTEFGSENSSSPSVKCLAQWDQNNTVVI